MKISYGEKIKTWGSNGTVYTQRLLLTERAFIAIQNAIASEIALGYPRWKEYSFSEGDAKLYLKPMKVTNIKEGNYSYLTLTQARYISKFAETKGRLKDDRNTYIKIEG